MKPNTFRIAGLVFALVFIAADCNSQTPTTSGPSSGCPPIGTGSTAQVGGSDGSSITVYANTYGDTDTSPSSPWCSPAQLSINAVNPSSLPPCPYAGCLAAVDVKPDNISFSNPANSTATKPTLSYDLAEHPTSETQPDPEACTGTYSCFSFYRLSTSNSWVFAGSATTALIGSEWFATGRINHFSIFALVDLPQPNPVSPPRFFGMIVQSAFHDDENGGLSVAVIVAEDSDGEYAVENGERILRLTGVEPIEFEGELDPACQDAPRLEIMFSCMFPINSRIELIYEEEISSITALESGLAVRFAVQNVEIH